MLYEPAIRKLKTESTRITAPYVPIARLWHLPLQAHHFASADLHYRHVTFGPLLVGHEPRRLLQFDPAN
jgi:hypothetical protein